MRLAGPSSRRGGERVVNGLHRCPGRQSPRWNRGVHTFVPSRSSASRVRSSPRKMLCSGSYDYQTYANALVKSVLVDSASTASTVAIDNKIEQAMDLVKSHLMFAVREEVEVLKEKITELLDRISQLEYENMVLRQYATQEALQQIQQHHASNT